MSDADRILFMKDTTEVQISVDDVKSILSSYIEFDESTIDLKIGSDYMFGRLPIDAVGTATVHFITSAGDQELNIYIPEIDRHTPGPYRPRAYT